MAIHSFGISNDGGNDDGSMFDRSLTDYRSDVEQRHTPVAINNNESNDLLQVRKIADETINVSGAEVKVYARTDNADYDAVWDSDADPTYWNSVSMKAFFKPQTLEMELKKWGIDTPNKTDIVFSHRQLYLEFGERMLRVGDVIKIPFNAATQAVAPNTYRIINASPTGNFRYNWIYFTCSAEIITADITVMPTDSLPLIDDEKTKSGGVYRESL